MVPLQAIDPAQFIKRTQWVGAATRTTGPVSNFVFKSETWNGGWVARQSCMLWCSGVGGVGGCPPFATLPRCRALVRLTRHQPPAVAPAPADADWPTRPPAPAPHTPTHTTTHTHHPATTGTSCPAPKWMAPSRTAPLSFGLRAWRAACLPSSQGARATCCTRATSARCRQVGGQAGRPALARRQGSSGACG